MAVVKPNVIVFFTEYLQIHCNWKANDYFKFNIMNQ